MRMLTPALSRAFQLVVVTFFIGMLPYMAMAQVDGDFRSLTSGTWTVNTTWQRYNGTTSQWVAATAGQVPTSSSTVLIRNTHTVTVSTATNFACGNLTVGEGSSGILNIQGVTVAITGSTTIASGGSLVMQTSSAGTKSFTGDFTNNGTFTNSINTTVTFLGNVTNNGTFTQGSSATYTFSGTSKTISTTNSTALTLTNATFLGSYTISANFALANPFNVSSTTQLSNAASAVINNGVFSTATLTIANAAGIFTNNKTVTVSSTFNGSTSSSFINAAGSVLNVGASTINPVITATANANLVNYNGTSQTIKSTTYHNLTVSGSGTKSLGGAITVNKDIVVSGTATLADGAQTITGNASGTFQLGSGTGYTTTRTTAPWFPTNIPLANYTIDNNSTVTFGAAATLTNIIPAQYGNLVLGSGSKTLPASFPITVNGNLSVTGLLNDNGNTITVKGGISGSAVVSGNGKILLSGGSAPHSVQGTIWNNVELDDAQGATLAAAFTLGTGGTFTLTNGVVSMNNFDFTLSNTTGGLAGSGFSATKMILQNGTGGLIRSIANSGLPVTYVYPIGENTGTTEYSPVSITVNTNTSVGNLEMRVTDSQHPSDIATTNYASRYWTAATVPSSLTSYTATFGYTPADIVGTESTFDVMTYDGASTWAVIPATAAANQVTYDAPDNGGIALNEVFTVKAPNTFPSTVTIDGVGGSAGVYANLTGTTGLFAALNQGVLTGNLTVNVTAAGTITETGAVALNQVSETGAGAGTYTITIQSNNSTPKVFEGTYTVATTGLVGLIRLNGADRVTFNGGTGTDRRLLFRNLSAGTSATVFHFLNDASNNKINNCTIEGSTISTTLGLVHIGTSVTGGTGNDNIVITNNDIKEAGANTPGIGISGDGFSSTVLNNDCEISNNKIYNIFRTSSTVAAIFINSYNTGWTISGNKIYQEATRSGSISSSNYGIFMNATTSNGMLITGNTIGYGAADGTGMTTYTSSNNGRFSAITSNGTASGAINTITNNIINNIAVTTTSGGSQTYPAFSGIALVGGKALVDGNYIGATSGVASSTNGISINTPATSTALASSPAAILSHSIATDQTISNNHIGAMSFTIGANVAINMAGIRISNSGDAIVQGNEIGNATAGSFLVSNTVTGTGAGAVASGIAALGSGFVDITDNVVQNISANSTTTTASVTSQAIGINVSSSGVYTIEGNEIKNLTSNSQSTSATAPSVVGIMATAGSTQVHSLLGNTIYNLTNTSAANSVVTGIYFTGNSSSVSQINKNFIYNLRSGTGTASVINGIHVGTGYVSVSNNRIRLGYDASGAAITNSSVITGILKENTTANNSIYYNSVYIGGTGVVSATNNTYAFRRASTGANDNVRNNIFVNARANASGTGKHYGVYLNNTTTLTQDYNLIYTTGTGTVFGFDGTADRADIAAWKANTAFDDNSVSANPQFEDPTNGTSPNLKLKTNVATPAESGAVAIAGLTDDFETANVRTGYPLGLPQGGTAPDIGADEANLIPLDMVAPVFSYTNIPTQAVCGTTSTTVQVTITDGQSGISLSANKPRMYFRRSVGAPTTSFNATDFVEGTYVSGTTNASVWSFTLNYTAFGITPAASNSFEYYFVAQDLSSTPNVGYSQSNGTTPVHAPGVSGGTTLTFPGFTLPASGTFSFTSTAPLSGTVNVGAGQTYTSLNANASTGLFYALMNYGLSGNLTVNITSDLNEAGLYYVLGNIPEYCGSGYTVTIVPSSASVKTIYQASGGNPLINLQGCTRIVFDGSYSNTGRYLTFASRQNTPTFYFNGNTNNVTIKNCTIEGNNQLLNSVGPGVINFAGLLGTGSAISNITINNNIIRDRSDITGTASIAPNSLIHAGPSSSTDATSTPVKSNITISNNEMFNFRESAIQIRQNSLGNGIGDNITITGNKIYEPINFSTYQYPVWLEGGINSKGHTISNNLIGGNASPSPDITGTWTNPKADGEIFAIYAYNGGTTPANGINISNNKISNITLSGGGWTNFLGIRVEEGTATVQNNLIGSLASSLSAPNIVCAGGGSTGLTQNSAVMGIWTQSAGEVLIDGNTVCGVQGTSSNGYIFFDGIAHGGNLYLNDVLYNSPGGKATITNNQVIYSRCASRLSNLAIPSPEGFMGIFCWTNATNNVIRGNKVNNCGSGTTTFGSNVRIHGMFVGVYGATQAQTGVVENNTISYLFNENTGDPSNSTSRNPIIYGLTIANGNWTVSNNSIYLNNGTQGGSLITNTNTSIRALNDGMLYNQSNCQAAYYHNTVVVAGSNLTGAGNANSTYAFLRFPLDYGSIAITAGAPITLRNNIFINNRGGSGNHRAIGNIANSNSDAAINWSSTSSDNNLYATTSSSMVSLWGASTSYDLASFKTLSGGDANSITATTTSGTSSSSAINPSELFVNLASGSAVNLRINTTPPNAPYPYDFVSNKGTAVGITTDMDGETRTSTPDIGADEFFICTTPVISANTPTNPTCSGNDGSIALTGLAANTTFSVTYNRNATPVAAANYTTNGSGVLTITGLDGGTYNNIVVSLGAGCSSAAYPASGSITLTAPVCGPNTWQGDVVGAGTDWFNNGNWSTGVAPTSCADNVVIPTNPIGNNFPVITGASAQVGNITVQSGATISIDNARTLSVCGDFTGSSTATASTVTGAGKVVLTGSAAQAVSGRTTFSTLQVAKTTGTVATVQSGSNLSVTTALELASGNLTNSGSLTLKSTATTHAIFNDFGAPVGTYTGTYTGSINEERYYRATSANSYNQHYMGSPVANATLAQFGAGGTSGAVTPTADCSETQLDQTSVYGSVFSYNEADGATCPMKSWTVRANSTAATPAQGFSVAKTGAGTLTVSGTPNTATSYAVAGLTNSNWTKGTLQHPSNTAFGSGWHMVSNPYNATLDLTSITPPAGFDNQIQVWDVIQGQYYTLTGTKLIAPFQAFFVHKTSPGGSATYTIDGNWRVATPATFYAQSIPEQLTITATNTANQLYDVTTVGFNQSATDQFDPQYDANKLTGSIGRHNLSTQNNGYELNTNILSSIQTTSTVNMTFEPGSAGTYTLTFEGLNSFDPTSYIMLEDKQLNTMHDVRSGDYTFTATAQDDWNRFVLHFTPKAEIATVDQQCETPGTINITQPGSANWTYTLTDNNTTTISSGTLNEATPVSVNTTTGTYTLTLTDNNNYQVVKTVTVNGTTPIVAAFSPSSNVTTTNTDVAFNSSTTATDYYWDFGDGTTATGQNVIHSYSDTGTYTVSLIVVSANGCSNTTTQTVTVNAEVQTGLNNLNGNQNITIWSNGNTVYVDFSRLAKTDATIEVYNVLGQQLVNERFKNNSIYTTAIGNLEAAYVLVKVKQGDAITTKKVLIANTK